MFRFPAIIGTLLAAAWFATPARAASATDEQALQMQIFGHTLAPGKAHACFHRVYDKAHLAGHPQQNVRSMTLMVTGQAEDVNAPAYSIGIDVRFRKTGTRFETYGSCWSLSGEAASAAAQGFNCGVDCDGGEIDVTLKGDKSVLVSIPEGARVWEAGTDEDAPSEGRGHFGSDDKLFRLDRTALTDCLPLAGDDDEKAALNKGE